MGCDAYEKLLCFSVTLLFSRVFLPPPTPGGLIIPRVEPLRWLRSLFAFEIMRPHIDDLEIQLYRTVRVRSRIASCSCYRLVVPPNTVCDEIAPRGPGPTL